MQNKIRSTYAILPEAVYQGSSLIPAHTDPLSGQTIAARAIYTDEAGDPLTFTKQFPGARQSNDSAKRLVKDSDWTRRDLFGLEQIIALAGFQAEADGVQQYGIFQHAELVGEVLQRPEWATTEEV